MRQLALSGFTRLERVFELWMGLLDENILSWQCNYLEMIYVSIQLLWFFANKACLKQGITCMQYSTASKALISWNYSVNNVLEFGYVSLSLVFLLCSVHFGFVCYIVVLSSQSSLSLCTLSVDYHWKTPTVLLVSTLQTSICAPSIQSIPDLSYPEDFTLLFQIPLQDELLPGWSNYLKIIVHRCRWSEVESCCFNMHSL